MKAIGIPLFLILFFISCSGEREPEFAGNKKIGLSFDIESYAQNSTRATHPGTDEERAIMDFYLFLFPTQPSQTLLKYYITPMPSFPGGVWSGNKISLDRTQTEVGQRNVYLIANCAAIMSELDGVDTVDELLEVLLSTAAPWSTGISTPLLMSGNATHDFMANYQLNHIALIRTVAKVQLNITLTEKHRDTPLFSGEPQYNYRYIDFDKNTYLFKPSVKTDALATSAWIAWDAAGENAAYSLFLGKVAGLTLTTYLNERDNAGSAIDIRVPYLSGGLLPPPEFGDEVYKLLLPAKIERNHWYIYDVAI